MEKTVVAYMRVSTEGQVDKYGIDAQRADIMAYCAKNGMYISKWYVDNGVSGVKDSRPEFDKLIYGEDIENPPISAVVVAKNDRVARDINVYFYFKMLLKKRDIELISVSEDFGQYGPMAHFLEAFTMCVAELERENITKRTSAGRVVKAKQGGYAGGRLPYGYKVTDGMLVVEPGEAEVVRKVFELRNSGMKLREITDVLCEMGVRTQTGKEFTISTVQNILKNEKVYKGKKSYGGIVYDGKYEHIL